ncbi:motility associated factor glycosyltransferase family protein [Aliarcobacter butzleri]|uniref:motility associated factor glycosyltransferase family protein n=1 Tax=Aliarcobacter butzleri TaxID=28197 RepID=UPI001EDA3580|nr:6-hydroxymethylpterin diphosphokinase MptE-like protein [Aliarcobacter butzleri]MCG3685608.1 DUF115 domain-containing protein [Aliarcobacter butzleri]MCT7562666.1 DUF115 domain-containing protein [Aliarcobacter butzleri]MCT7637580.1 DUF115 domain-containing protein [Aliarcobacter butzleri]
MDKQKQLEELQQTLSAIYLKNIEFLKKNEPNLYKKIEFFEKLNIENYSLDFVNEQFKLVDLKTKENLYKNEEPFSNSLKRVNSFDISNAFSLVQFEILNKKVVYKDEITASVYLNEYIKNFENIELKVDKFVFFGTLLGVHLNDFHKSLNAKVYLVIEPNIEIFRLSLFLCDYEELAKTSKIFFAIGENEDNLFSIIDSFFEYKYEINSLIHFEKIDNSYDILIEKLQSHFTSKSQMRYPFSEFLISLKRGYNYFLNEKKAILNLDQKCQILEDKKVLFLGAGVSLAKNLEWVYLNQEKFIIVASSAVLKHLRILDIVPDIILAIDGQKDVMLEQFNTDKKMYENSIILASIKLDEEVFEKVKESKIFFMQNALELFAGFGSLSGISVGDLGVDILAKLGSSEIYLLGVDAALDSKNGKTHIGTHLSSRKIDLNKKDSGNFRDDVVYTKGNFDEKVPTFREYLEMISSLEEIIANHKNSTKVYNLGSGAYFKGSFPLKIADFNYEKIDKDRFKNKFLNSLESISKKTLSNIDINELIKEKKILKRLQSVKLEKFFVEFKTLFGTYANSTILNIFDRFFKLVLPYYNMLKNRSLADEILQKQICEVLNSFDKVFCRIDNKTLKV